MATWHLHQGITAYQCVCWAVLLGPSLLLREESSTRLASGDKTRLAAFWKPRGRGLENPQLSKCKLSLPPNFHLLDQLLPVVWPPQIGSCFLLLLPLLYWNGEVNRGRGLSALCTDFQTILLFKPTTLPSELPGPQFLRFPSILLWRQAWSLWAWHTLLFVPHCWQLVLSFSFVDSLSFFRISEHLL